MGEEAIGISEAPLMTVQGLASYFSVSKSLIYKWVEEGKIPHYRFGKTVRFDPCQVKEWLEYKKVQPQISSVDNVRFERDVDRILKSTTIGGKI